MPQTILSAVIEVQPASAALVMQQLEALKAAQKQKPQTGDQSFDHLRDLVPMLHFMSISVVPDDQYDPVLVLEANFDGEPDAFWRALDAAIGQELREILRHCKAPRDSSAALFDTITAPGSSAPLVPLLTTLTVSPAVKHQGNRGITRLQIIREGKLFQALRQAVDAQPSWHQKAAADIHQQLRAQLLPRFTWLNEPSPRRIGVMENIADWLRLIGLVAAALLLFFGVGWLLLQALHAGVPPLAGFVDELTELLPGAEGLVRALVLVLLGAAALLGPAAWWLRHLEQTDASNDAPRVDEAQLREMARREDAISQNHMISIVHVKPGVLRMVIAQLVLRALGLWLRITARNGYLASMRTIHFAHWAFLNNGGRLMFHSNFDGSWESYLDDFIEKAHAGLTAAWTHGVGFPKTEWLIQGGATEGRKFKAWARHSMAPSQFWFSAYKEYSVNQIERHARLANGLRKARLSEQEAQAWVLDL